jgi:hypothetical protein
MSLNLLPFRWLFRHDDSSFSEKEAGVPIILACPTILSFLLLDLY